MKLRGDILVILSAVLVLSGAKVIKNSEIVSPRNTSEIRCEYEHYTQNMYACFLTINNAEGRDDFTIIEGEHKPNMTNNDVTMVYAVFQNSRVIPRIICQTFPNTVDYLFYDSKVELVTEDSFAACRNIQSVSLNYNNIEVIPNRLFASNPNLQRVTFENNLIRVIAPNAFAGTHRISYLDLGYNHIDVFSPVIFSPLANTLQTLYLNGNRLRNLQAFAFSEFSQLIELDIGINEFDNIPGNVFYGLLNLETLYLDRTNRRTIDAAWFMSLFNLRNLELHYNFIRELPVNAFNNLVNLQELSLFANNLTFVNRNAFGPSLTNLTFLFLSNNQLEAVDERIIDEAANLQSLYLSNNLCIDSNFFNIPLNREQVRQNLQTCITSFQGSINCTYLVTSMGYECLLNISNVAGHNFPNITGNHLPGYTNANVTIVAALFQNTRTLPNVICSQFPNLEDIRIDHCRLEIISETSFANCPNLWYVNLNQNNIENIPDNTFRNNPNLERFYAVANSISNIGNNAFTGSSLRRIYLEDNRLTSFNNPAFEAVSSTLEELFIYGNQITQLSPGAFNNFPVLDTLILDENPLRIIPPNAFRGLFNLTHLSLEACNIEVLEPEWFQDLSNLRDIRLDHNRIRRLPPGIFSNLRNLWVISIDNNSVRNINSNAFGAALDSIVQFDATNNGIRAFDEEILTRSQNLAVIHLRGNQCVNQDFANVQGNMPNVTSAMAECSRMFTGFLNCEFVRVRNDYICHLTIQNVQPRDDFFYIPGTHMTDMTDNDITVLDAMRQDSLNIPSIICRQFPNLVDLYIDESHVEFINEDAFEYCTRLEWLDLYGNEILSVPDFTFSHSPRLKTIYLLHNFINHIGPNAFVGTNITMLDLDVNHLTQLDRRWLQSVGNSLQVLYITHNQLTTIAENTFEGLTRLNSLNLGGNQIRTLPPRIFDSLTNLEYLWLHENRISEINPQWFENLSRLFFLTLFNNTIEDIPAFSFRNNARLREIDIGVNQIRVLHTDSFGPALNSLSYLMADRNLIEMISPEILSSTSIQFFYLVANKCANRNYYGVQNNLNSTRLSLQSCFDNFNRPVPMSCEYLEFPGYDYTCYLASEPNLAGNDNTVVIEGNHASNRTNSDVLVLESYNQVIRTVPSVICNQFPNLYHIWLTYNRIQTLRPSSFSGCTNLRVLVIEANPIHVIPAGLFVANSVLETLWLDSNRIYSIENGAFSGTAVNSLGLAVNQFSSIQSGWFDGITDSLQALYLYANFLRSNPEGGFGILRNLQVLDIGLNEGFVPTSNAFNGLTNLQELYMDDNQFRYIDPAWFTSLQNLVELRIHRNGIHFIPDGAFQPLSSIRNFVIGDQSLRFLGIEAFGNNSLQNLHWLSLVNADLHAFDMTIFDRTAPFNLNMLYMFGNPCANMNFYNVQNEQDVVRAELESCFNNFQGSLGCQYFAMEGFPYMCELSLNNIAGRNHFTSVPGNHVGQNTNADVRLVEALGQETRNVPSIICQTFTNTEDLYIINSGLEIVDETSFTGCTRLSRLILPYNNIHFLPSDVFLTNPALYWLSLNNNQISQISESALRGTQLYAVELYNNRLHNFNPRWFDGANQTINFIDIKRNSIAAIPDNAFDNLRNLTALELSYNDGLFLPSTVFNPLTNLISLAMDEIGLRRLDAGWFSNTLNLELLSIGDNRIRRLQDGIFSNLVNLQDLNIRNNSIDYLSVYQFGWDVRNITYLMAEYNRINAFDILLFDQISDLNILYMAGNRCFNDNIYDVRGNREGARERLWTCFENYGIDVPDKVAD